MAESKTAKSFVDGHIADTEEQKSAVRKRNLLVLILHYLQHQGLMTTAESLKTESTLKLDQYVLCDNVDLELILQEYETFQFVKFRKQPHITRKLEESGTQKQSKSSRGHSTQGQSTQTSSNGSGSFCSTFRIRGLHRASSDEKHKSDSQLSKGKLENAFRPENITIDRRLGIQICTPGVPQLKLPQAMGATLGSEWFNLVDIISKDVYVDSPNVHWNDIVGLESAKRLIKEALIYPMKVLFELARHNSPATIFLDELDALVGAKGGLGNSENEASRRMKSELLIQMDGLSNSKDHVFVLATSNSPWDLDHSVLRRLEKRILVPLPGKEARTFLFHKFLEGGQSAKSGGRRESCFVAADIDYNLVSEASEGYSGSDIKIACKEAVMKSLRQALEAAECCDNEADGTDRIIPEPVSTQDILDAIKQTKPTGKALAAKFETWHQEYGSSLS
ncbi:hypothetical protein HPB50_016577 [Hyalomma asiaticum]|uniref:Uncharacterized protein n=1 Tax=Hyalomma asiaticum TaxID=266040 RepID=A0ACB7SWL3_HYAAI|nr:hypothetical protein HPB50_016577 [Hyalomma asiaticum]